MYAERKSKTFEIIILTYGRRMLKLMPKRKSLGSTFTFMTLSGKNPSAVEVAEASMTKKSPTLFGIVNIFDDPLPKGPEPIAKFVGRAQCLYGSAGQQEFGLLLARNLVFTTEKFNGSSLFYFGQECNFSSNP